MSDEEAPQMEPFTGYVVLKNWMLAPSKGHQVLAVGGRVSVIHQDKLVGFKVKGGESNWVAIIEGETELVIVLGCQVRSFITSAVHDNNDVLVVP